MPTTLPIQSWWIQIEGVPDRITYGEPTSEAFRVDHDDLSDIPASIADSCDPITAEVNLSSFNFRVNASDELVRLLLYQQFKAPGTLFQAVSDSATTIFVTNGPALELGDPIYIGRETLRVVADLGGTPRGYTVARGQWDSLAAEHEAGAPVFVRVPKWRGRRIELYSRDTSRNVPTTLRWAGYVDKIKRSPDGTRILVDARNLWTAAIETTASRGIQAATNVSCRVYSVGDDPYRPIIRATATIPRPIIYRTPQPMFYAQLGQALVVCNVQAIYDDEATVEVFGRPLLGSRLAEEYATGDRFTAELRPVFLISPLADAEWSQGASEGFDISTQVGGRTVTPSAVSPHQSPYYAHPLEIAVLLLTGGVPDYTGGIAYVDYLGAYTLDLLGLLGADFVDDVIDLMALTPDLQVDHFLVGWGGEEIDVIQVVSEKLLRPYGYFFGVTQEGKPSIRRFGAMRVDEVEAIEAAGRVVEALPGPFVGEVDPSLENSVDSITAAVGGLPWSEARNVTVQTTGASSGRTRINDGGRWEVDYSTISKARTFDVIEDLVRKSTFSAFSFPRLRVRVPDTETADLYDVGGTIRIDTLPVEGGYLLDSSGELVEFLDENLDAQLQFYGLIISRQYDAGPRTYELVVMLTSWRTAPIRLRGPSGIIDTAGADFITLEASPFGSLDGDDFAAFAEFYDPSMTVFLDFCSEDLTVQDTYEVDSFDAGTGEIFLTTAPVVAGPIVRLSSYNAGYQFPASGLTVYNFLADANDQLDGTDRAHEYA